MSIQKFKHVIAVQVRFSDIDRLNHVNNACYHNYFELARVNYFNQVLGEINWDEFGFVLARTELDHIEPVFLKDEIYCYTRVKKLGNKSLQIENLLVKKVEGNLIETAACIGTLVAMDYRNNISIPIPDKWRKLFTDFDAVEKE